MQERNIINGIAAASVAPFLEFYDKLIPYLLVALALIITDSRFGVAAARVRGEAIRPSRKWRRAMNKLVDYICWVTLAGLFGNTFGTIFHIPILSAIMLLFVYGIELSSIVNNYLEYKHIHKHIDITKLFLKLFKREDMAEVIIDDNIQDGKDQDNSER
ncbi:MAG: phage holin family protein [Alistipes sp.]|nr:phage holin family protein [Alistipes sp.]